MRTVPTTLPFVLLAAAALNAATPGSTASAAEAGGSDVSAATSAFAVDLYGALRDRDGDIFFSPLSVTTALATTSAGARGETAEQIRRALHLDRLGADALTDLGRWLASVDGSTPPSAKGDGAVASAGLWTANAVWIDAREKLLPDFAAFVERSFKASAQTVDFAHEPVAARRTINRWVEERTHERIKDLLKPSHVTPGTVFVLTSTIYFKGDWAHPFPVHATRDADFRLARGPAARVKMMSRTAHLPYSEDETLQALELPYKDGSLTMVVLLPRRVDGLAELEAALSVENLNSWLGALKPHQVAVSLPRFTSTAEIELNDVLKKLGMPLAFSAGADFSGVAGSPDLALSAVVHKAFVEVEEKGTEAAAATAVVGTRAAAMIPAKEAVFRADHPFVYLIRHAKSGAILFMGRLSRP